MTKPPEFWSLSAGAALAKGTELMGMNQETGLLVTSVGGRKDQS